jgi:hypothetical protein
MTVSIIPTRFNRTARKNQVQLSPETIAQIVELTRAADLPAPTETFTVDPAGTINKLWIPANGRHVKADEVRTEVQAAGEKKAAFETPDEVLAFLWPAPIKSRTQAKAEIKAVKDQVRAIKSDTKARIKAAETTVRQAKADTKVQLKVLEDQAAQFEASVKAEIDPAEAARREAKKVVERVAYRAAFRAAYLSGYRATYNATLLEYLARSEAKNPLC